MSINQIYQESCQGIKINGYTNKWSALDTTIYDGKMYGIFENDTFGDETYYLLCDITDGIQVVAETYDDIWQTIEDLFG